MSAEQQRGVAAIPATEDVSRGIDVYIDIQRAEPVV